MEDVYGIVVGKSDVEDPNFEDVSGLSALNINGANQDIGPGTAVGNARFEFPHLLTDEILRESHRFHFLGARERSFDRNGITGLDGENRFHRSIEEPPLDIFWSPANGRDFVRVLRISGNRRDTYREQQLADSMALHHILSAPQSGLRSSILPRTGRPADRQPLM